MSVLSSLGNLLLDACIIFKEDVDNFEIEHKTCLFWVECAVPRKCSKYTIHPLHKSPYVYTLNYKVLKIDLQGL